MNDKIEIRRSCLEICPAVVRRKREKTDRADGGRNFGALSHPSMKMNTGVKWKAKYVPKQQFRRNWDQAQVTFRGRQFVDMVEL